MTVLITGASRGIGRGLFDHYTALGEQVVGTARRPDAPGLTAQGGWLAVDVSVPGDVATLSKSLDGKPLDLLICNAGIYEDKGQSLDSGYPPEMWATGFATNVTGVFLTIQALLPNLRATNAAKIAIISSQMASQERAPGGSYIYRASKAAVLNLGRNLASDLRTDGIAVGIYHPGWVRTDMGGGSADISTEASVSGLSDRFRDLTIDTTGCFETWDGRPHPF